MTRTPTPTPTPRGEFLDVMLVLLVGIMALLGACSEPEHGTVYGRWYYPESQWVEMTCMSYKTDGTCLVYVPVIRTDPERWSLGLRSGDDDEGTRTVTEREYESCRNGDEYPDCVRDAFKG